MTFKIPNEATATYGDQAEPDSVDFDILAAAFARSCVVSGCAVTQRGAGANMSVDVAAGEVSVAGVAAVVSAVNVSVTTADATNARFDLVSVNASGTVAVTAGTASSNPVFPAIPASSVALAAVYVPAAATSVVTAQITDKRIIDSSGAPAIVALTASTATSPISGGGVFDVNHNANWAPTFAGSVAGSLFRVYLRMTQDGTGGRTFTPPTGTTWIGQSTLVTTASAVNLVVLETWDGGTTWVAYLLGPTSSGSGITAATAAVTTQQTTTSTSFTDLTTAGPAVTATVGTSGTVLVIVSAGLVANTANYATMAFAVSGANTAAADAAKALISGANNNYIEASRSVLLTGLTAGSTTFTAKYNTTGGTATFERRTITVLPL